jgi:hypothetical protein
MSILHRMSLFVACLTLLWLTGCNKTPKRETVFGSLQSASDKPMGLSEVTPRPAVKAMETNEALETLRGQSSDGFGFVFDPRNEKARALKPGDVLLIKGLLARKVIATDTTKDGVVVLTKGASIADVKLTLQFYTHAVSRDRMAAAGRMLTAILGNAANQSGLPTNCTGVSSSASFSCGDDIQHE